MKITKSLPDGTQVTVHIRKGIPPNVAIVCSESGLYILNNLSSEKEGPVELRPDESVWAGVRLDQEAGLNPLEEVRKMADYLKGVGKTFGQAAEDTLNMNAPFDAPIRHRKAQEEHLAEQSKKHLAEQIAAGAFGDISGMKANPPLDTQQEGNFAFLEDVLAEAKKQGIYIQQETNTGNFFKPSPENKVKFTNSRNLKAEAERAAKETVLRVLAGTGILLREDFRVAIAKELGLIVPELEVRAGDTLRAEVVNPNGWSEAERADFRQKAGLDLEQATPKYDPQAPLEIDRERFLQREPGSVSAHPEEDTTAKQDPTVADIYKTMTENSLHLGDIVKVILQAGNHKLAEDLISYVEKAESLVGKLDYYRRQEVAPPNLSREQDTERPVIDDRRINAFREKRQETIAQAKITDTNGVIKPTANMPTFEEEFKAEHGFEIPEAGQRVYIPIPVEELVSQEPLAAPRDEG